MGKSASKQTNVAISNEFEQKSDSQKTSGSKPGDSESGNGINKQASKIIAAIDFGTSNTGFAYAFTDDIQHITTGKHGGYLDDDRVPTVVLLNPDGSLKSFGTEAEDDYSALIVDNKHYGYRLFQNFKMALYSNNEKLDKDLSINDFEGRPYKAFDVFVTVLKHLKGRILASMREGKHGDNSSFEDEILWMLTIPAISSDSARQFMRLAATKAGIPEDKLRLILEPEAAAIFCKNLLLNSTQNADLTKLPPGTKYILADLGGGTADICSHDILKDEHIRELYRVQGGSFGGTSVNNEYFQFLVSLFGAPLIAEFRKCHLFEFLRMMRDFEKIKTKFTGNNSSRITFVLPNVLTAMLQTSDLKLEDILAQSPLSSSVRWIPEKHILHCEVDIMKRFFNPSIKGIIDILYEIITSVGSGTLKTIILVGGHSECQYVRECIKEEMKGVVVVHSKEPRLAVLKGAVMMGVQSRHIIQRRARYTYGFCVGIPFREGVHPEELKFFRDRRTYCSNIFKKLIEKDQILCYNETFASQTTDTFIHLDSKKEVLKHTVYRSENRNPMYGTEAEHCTKIGKISTEPPVEGWPDHLTFDRILKVGETEFTVQVFNHMSKKEYTTNIDFL